MNLQDWKQELIEFYDLRSKLAGDPHSGLLDAKLTEKRQKLIAELNYRLNPGDRR